jgi:protein phosphatase
MKNNPVTLEDVNSSSNISSAFKLNAFSLTNRGKVREYNEDAVAFLTEKDFFAIADGMGGFLDGGQTADTVVAIIPTIVKDIKNQVRINAAPEEVGEELLESIRILSDNIAENGNLGHGIFGTTLTAVWFIDEAAVFANLGDSRAYILNLEGQLQQITRDHSIIGILLEQGEITSKEVDDHPARGQLTRYVGMPSPALPEMFVSPVKTGDRILLCSDGLSSMVPDDKIAEILAGGENPQEICQALVGAANYAGGQDNITVVVIIVDDKIEGWDMRRKTDSTYKTVTETQKIEMEV